MHADVQIVEDTPSCVRVAAAGSGRCEWKMFDVGFITLHNAAESGP